MTSVTMVVLALAAVASAARVVRRGTLVDRILGLDLLLYVLAGLVAVGAARSGDPSFRDLPIVVALLGVLGTVAAAVWLAARGEEEER